MSLLNPPPEDYLNEVSFFLTFGEQAPFKSASEVTQLTPPERDFWVKKLGEAYKKQREEMEKANQKNRVRSTKR